MIVTSAFLHYDLEHFLSNMAALRVFVPDVVHELGCDRFAYFYIASAYASTISDRIIFLRYIGMHNYECLLGASGILSAAMTFHCLSFPKKTFEVSGVALSAPLGALAWAINEALLLCGDDNIGHGDHLGRALFGAIVSVMTLLQSKSRKQFLKWIRDVCCSSQNR
jgi:membrane associated rhomboid family serine protease